MTVTVAERLLLSDAIGMLLDDYEQRLRENPELVAREWAGRMNQRAVLVQSEGDEFLELDLDD